MSIGRQICAEAMPVAGLAASLEALGLAGSRVRWSFACRTRSVPPTGLPPLGADSGCHGSAESRRTRLFAR